MKFTEPDGVPTYTPGTVTINPGTVTMNPVLHTDPPNEKED